MPDSSSGRARARTVALAGITLFVLVLGLLAVQMASGHDPALGAREPTKAAKHIAASPQPVQPPQPSYSDPGYGGYAQDTQQQDVPQPQAPLQSSTS